MKGNGMLISAAVGDVCILLMEQFMKESGMMIKEMAKAC